jgi:diguanylate cyclase (GGDEF)-like protein
MGDQPPHDVAARRRLLPEAAGVWALTAVLVALGAGLWWWLRDAPSQSSEIHLPWWVLAVGFAITEICVVHIHFRRSAHSLTLAEIPLVLGLLFGTPAEVIVGWVVGGGLLMLVAQRGRPTVQSVFNLAQFATTAGGAAAAFHLLDLPSSGPALWAGAAASALVADALASLLIGAAMRLSGELVTLSKLARAVASGSFVAATNACLALAGAVVLVADPWAAPLLVVPVAAMYLAYRAYTAEHNRHARLEFLYDATRVLTRAPTAESGLAGVLAMALETFRAELADGCLFPASGDEPGTDVAIGPGDGVVVGAAGGGMGTVLAALVADRPGAHIVHARDLTGAAAEQFRARGIDHAMVAALPGGRRTVGALLVANRLGVGGAFGADEMRMFETLARHTAATLEQDRLGRTVSELQDIQRHLEHQAFHDPLTGLANRLLFTDRIRHALSRRGGNVALLYIDLDDFKAVNDTLGHEAGDELLQETARRLLASLRTADTPARLGGDEFAVLLVDISEAHTRVVAERILENLRAPFALAGRDVPVHASLGVALSDSGAVGVEQLMREADTAMYVSKHGGKRGYSVYEPAAA